MGEPAVGKPQFLAGFHHHWLDILVDLFPGFLSRNGQLIMCLEVYPEFRWRTSLGVVMDESRAANVMGFDRGDNDTVNHSGGRAETIVAATERDQIQLPNPPSRRARSPISLCWAGLLTLIRRQT